MERKQIRTPINPRGADLNYNLSTDDTDLEASPARRLEVGHPGETAGASGGPVTTPAEVEMAVVEQPATQQLAGASAGAQPSRGDAVEQLTDRPPLAGRDPWVQGCVLRSKSRLAPSRLHGSPPADDPLKLTRADFPRL
jgi:hypothetical protein